jgi:alkanesulfonate monooxygenase SsuD/methylene tetrahydromethanopterin reductase-like flavin-dependent oxidoreductase (luciferase family)
VADIARPIRGAAVGAKTSRIEIGTAVIDMRYENPLYMVEDAGAANLIAGGRLQLGISRGSPEQVIGGWRCFGYRPAEGQSDVDMGRLRAEVFLDLLRGGDRRLYSGARNRCRSDADA